MAVYYKNGVKYVGTAAEREMAKDNKKKTTTTTSNTSSTNGSAISRDNGTSGTTSNGSTSSGGSSGGGTSNYSPYTAPTLGNTWDANTDYATIINKAVAAGDYVTAAQAEKLRNQKIIESGMNYDTSNRFSGWLDNTDYATIGTNQMASGASWQEVLDTYNKRYHKANGTEGLEQYANDDFQKLMESYINQNKALEASQNQMEEWEQENQRPDAPQSDPRIDAILNEILNREDFSYNAMNDPLYQQYADMYHREGDRAMKETMAEAAAGAGGMNTYAITAAQQANSYYNSQLNDKIPELYQLAYQMYLQDKESKVQDLGILQGMDATQYNRYRDTINDWYNDKNFAYGAYQDAVQQGNWQTSFNNDNYWKNKEFDYNDYWANKNFDYNDFWNNKNFDYNDLWKNKEYTDNRADVEYERNQTEAEEAQATIDWLIKNGVTSIDPEIIKKAGLDEATVKQMITYYQQQNAPKVTSSGGTKVVYKTKDENDDEDDINDDEPKKGEVTDAGKVAKGLTDLGLGLVYSPEVIADLADAGAIYEKDGKLVWSTGWNAGNFEEKLRKQPFPNLISPLNW